MLSRTKTTRQYCNSRFAFGIGSVLLDVLEHWRIGGFVGEVDHRDGAPWYENSLRFLRPHDVKPFVGLFDQLRADSDEGNQGSGMIVISVPGSL